MKASRFIPVALSAFVLAGAAVMSACELGGGSSSTQSSNQQLNAIIDGTTPRTAANLRRVVEAGMLEHRTASTAEAREIGGAIASIAASALFSIEMGDLFGVNVNFDPSLPSRSPAQWQELTPLERILIHGASSPSFRAQNQLLAEDLLPMNIIASLNDSNVPTGRAFPDSPTPAQVKAKIAEVLAIMESVNPYLEGQAIDASFLLGDADPKRYEGLELSFVRANANFIGYVLELFSLYEYDPRANSASTAHFNQTVAQFAGQGGLFTSRQINPAPYGDHNPSRGGAAKAKAYFAQGLGDYHLVTEAVLEVRLETLQNLDVTPLTFEIFESDPLLDMLRSLRSSTAAPVPGGSLNSEPKDFGPFRSALGRMRIGTEVLWTVRSDDQTGSGNNTVQFGLDAWLDSLPASIANEAATGISIVPSGDRYKIEVFGVGNSAPRSDFLRRHLGMLSVGVHPSTDTAYFSSTPRFVSKDATVYELSRIFWDDLLPDSNWTFQ